MQGRRSRTLWMRACRWGRAARALRMARSAISTRAHKARVSSAPRCCEVRACAVDNRTATSIDRGFELLGDGSCTRRVSHAAAVPGRSPRHEHRQKLLHEVARSEEL